MIARWRSLMRPDEAQHVASPDVEDAFAVWVLGILWSLACVWLGFLGHQGVVPGVLLAGLLAVWGWRHAQWLWWFPSGLVVASGLQAVFAPQTPGLGYVDLLVTGVTAVALARAIGLVRPLLPRTPMDGVAAMAIAAYGVTLVFSSSRTHAPEQLQRLIVIGAAFYAATSLAMRPGGARWVWVAFPLACGLVGAHAVWAFVHDPLQLATQADAADRTWEAEGGLVNVLVVALPLTAGLAVNAGTRPARRLWALAALAGAAGLVTHLAARDVWGGARWVRTSEPSTLAHIAVAMVVLLALARIAWSVRAARPHEAARWTAVTLACVLCALLEPGLPVLTGPAAALVGLMGGLVAGTRRADLHRAGRDAEETTPAIEEAA